MRAKILNINKKMKITDLNEMDQSTTIGKALNLRYKKQFHIEYIAPFYSGMRKGERREYSQLNEANEAEIKKTAAYIMENEAIFNSILEKYRLSCAVFLSKFILN